MITEQRRAQTRTPEASQAARAELRDAGRRCAQAYPLSKSRRPHLPAAKLRLADLSLSAAGAAHPSQQAGVRWLAENMRLLRTAAKDCHGLNSSLRRHPGVTIILANLFGRQIAGR